MLGIVATPVLGPTSETAPPPHRSFKQRLFFFLLTHLGWLVILILGRLTRIRYIGREHRDWLVHHKKPYIYCVWHGRILLPIFVHRGENIQAMVSRHEDGEMIARTLHRLGYQSVRGSSTRGGQRATIEMIRHLKEGGTAAIMPDGPRGPRHDFKIGALVIAQRTGAYLLPFTFSASRTIVFKSWDRFMLLLPFARSVAVYGEPIQVPRDAGAEELEQLRLDVERRMIRLECQADSYFEKT